MNIFILNFLFYLLWFWKDFSKQKCMNVYNFMILIYTFFALAGIIVIDNGIYQQEISPFNEYNISILPYILCFISFIMLFRPLKKVDNINIDEYEIFNSKYTRKLINIWVILFIIFGIIKLVELKVTSSMGLDEAYYQRHIEGSNIFNYSGPLRYLNSFIITIQGTTVPLVMFYSMVGIIKKKISAKKSSFLILLCFCPELIGDIAKGDRGSIFMTMFCFVFFVLIFWKHLAAKIKRNIIFTMIFLGVCGGVYFWIISLQRAQSGNYDPLVTLYRYFGEPFPNLGIQIWGNVKYNPNGERIFSAFYPSHGFADTNVAVDYWWGKIGVPVYYFKTIFGDFYMEFGTIKALLYIFGLSISFSYVLTKLRMNFVTLPLLYYYYQICVYAFAGWTKSEWGALYQFICVVAFLLFAPKFLRKKNN